MFYLIELKNHAYVLDTSDNVIDKVSRATFNKIIKSIAIQGAGTSCNDSVPCVPNDYRVLTDLRSSCALVLNEIFTIVDEAGIHTHFAGKAIVTGIKGMQTLKNLLSCGIIALKSVINLDGLVLDTTEVAITYTANTFDTLPNGIYLSDYLIFSYFYADANREYMSVSKKLDFPFNAPYGLSSNTSMFQEFEFAGNFKKTYWDLRQYLLNKYIVLKI